MGGHVDANLSPKLSHRVAHVTVVLVVCGRNRNCGRIAENLGIIEVHAARIGMSPESLNDRISQSRPRAACAPPEITRVLVQDSWVNRLRHEITYEKVPVRSAEV